MKAKKESSILNSVVSIGHSYLLKFDNVDVTIKIFSENAIKGDLSKILNSMIGCELIDIGFNYANKEVVIITKLFNIVIRNSEFTSQRKKNENNNSGRGDQQEERPDSG